MKEASLEILEVIVEVGGDPHTHLREDKSSEQTDPEESIVGDLVDQAIEGGVDVVGGMPNTEKGLKTSAEVVAYNDYAKSKVPLGKVLLFILIMMLTEATPLEDLDEAKKDGVDDVKIYPYLRTTKSHNGVIRYGRTIPKVKRCGELGIRVHVHPEHPNMIYENRDAEFAFLPIVQMYLEETEAVIIWEHGTDARCIPFWEDFAERFPGRFYLTLTPHHLATSESKAYGDVRAVCKPPPKTETDRIGLVDLVRKNHPWVMAGSDNAPHPMEAKHVREGNCACGAAVSRWLILLYAHVLDSLMVTPEGREIFLNFTSRNMRKLYGLPPASRKIPLKRSPFRIPPSYKVGPWTVESFWAGKELFWSFAD